MNRVLIFTDYVPWSNMPPRFLRLEWADDYPKKGGNQLVKCLFRSGCPVSLAPAKDCREEGVYLVYDKIKPKLYDEIKRQCSEEGNLYVLYHSNTPHNRRDITKLENCTDREGRHDGNTKWRYPVILDILLGKADNKLELVVDALKYSKAEKVRKVIDKFVTCSVNPVANCDSLKKAYEELCTYDIWKKEVEEFFQLIDPEINPDVNYKSFKDKLDVLRDFLCEKAKEIAGEE